MTPEKPEALSPRWCLTGNIVEERRYGPLGVETRRGTRPFAPGAKVYCLPFDFDRLFALGRHRKSGRFIGSIVPAKHVVERRAQLIDHPEVLRRIEERIAAESNGVKSQWEDQASVEAFIATLDPLNSPDPEVVDPLTVEAYDELVASGMIVTGSPLELMNGVLVWKPKKTPARATCAGLARGEIERLVPNGYHLRCEAPVRIPPFSEPEPAISVVRGRAEDYTELHPGPKDAVLVVEITNPVFGRLRGEKRSLYARAGIPTYWILDTTARCVEIYERPKEEGYSSAGQVPAGGAIDLIVDGAAWGRLDVASILP